MKGGYPVSAIRLRAIECRVRGADHDGYIVIMARRPARYTDACSQASMLTARVFYIQ